MYNCEHCKRNFKNKGSYSKHIKSCEIINKIENEVRHLYINELWSINSLKKKFRVSSLIIERILGDSKRTLSEGVKIAHKKFPERFKHSDKTKQILREKRLKYMKENPHETAWRLKNLSYPEKLFYNKIIQLKWDEKYSIKREFSVFPYFVDFAFLNEKVAIEIDGSQHLLPERKLSDEKKDNLLYLNGWKVIRISERELKLRTDDVFEKISTILKENDKPKIYKIGIVSQPKKYQKKKRELNGLTNEQLRSYHSQRRVKRPTYKILIKEINQMGFVQTGKKYGVSDNTIRKWVKFCEKYEK